jgi:5,5'-dehydrodivanillate O-demethylase
MLHLTVRHRAYPVRKLAGLYWAYLGPEPAPEIPPYDVLVRGGGRRTVQLRARVDCNYLQAMENSVDSAHLQILHQDLAGRGRPVTDTTRGFTDDVASIDFYRTDYGIMKHRIYKDGTVDEHPLIFPNILRQGNGIELRVPLDDEHLWIYEVRYLPPEDGEEIDEEAEPEIVAAAPHKEPMGIRHPVTHHFMDGVDPQDYMAWETQGAIADRSVERLASSDKGVVMLRQLLKENILRVQRGEDPMGVLRDPTVREIDTNLTHSLVAEAGLYPASPKQAAKW